MAPKTPQGQEREDTEMPDATSDTAPLNTNATSTTNEENANAVPITNSAIRDETKRLSTKTPATPLSIPSTLSSAREEPHVGLLTSFPRPEARHAIPTPTNSPNLPNNPATATAPAAPTTTTAAPDAAKPEPIDPNIWFHRFAETGNVAYYVRGCHEELARLPSMRETLSRETVHAEPGWRERRDRGSVRQREPEVKEEVKEEEEEEEEGEDVKKEPKEGVKREPEEVVKKKPKQRVKKEEDEDEDEEL